MCLQSILSCRSRSSNYISYRVEIFCRNTSPLRACTTKPIFFYNTDFASQLCCFDSTRITAGSSAYYYSIIHTQSDLARLTSCVLRQSETSLASNFVAKLIFSDDAISSNVTPSRLVTLCLTSLIILSLSFSEGTFRMENILSTSTFNSTVPC